MNLVFNKIHKTRFTENNNLKYKSMTEIERLENLQKTVKSMKEHKDLKELYDLVEHELFICNRAKSSYYVYFLSEAKRIFGEPFLNKTKGKKVAFIKFKEEVLSAILDELSRLKSELELTSSKNKI